MDDYVTVHPVYLLWRDALDITKMIFGNPVFAQHMSLDPHEVYTEQGDREYGEWMSSKEAFRIQVSSFVFPLYTYADHIIRINFPSVPP